MVLSTWPPTSNQPLTGRLTQLNLNSHNDPSPTRDAIINNLRNHSSFRTPVSPHNTIPPSPVSWSSLEDEPLLIDSDDEANGENQVLWVQFIIYFIYVLHQREIIAVPSTF